jgi:hypothetical protein
VNVDQWSAVPSAFAVETILKNNDSVIATHRIFRRHFDNERHRTVPDGSTIKNWVRTFRTTASAKNERPGAQSEQCGHRRTLKEYEPLSVVAPNDQHIDIQLPATYPADRTDGYFNLIYIFTPSKDTLYMNCQTPILLQEVLCAICYLNYFVA